MRLWEIFFVGRRKGCGSGCVGGRLSITDERFIQARRCSTMNGLLLVFVLSNIYLMARVKMLQNLW